MRVFLDANVLFSASNSGSAIARLMEQAILRVELIINDFVEIEARRNLMLKRPEWLPCFEQLILGTQRAPMAIFSLPVPLETKDQPVLCSAIRYYCKYLVTGDRRDFGHLYDTTIEGVTVISPSSFAELLFTSQDA